MLSSVENRTQLNHNSIEIIQMNKHFRWTFYTIFNQFPIPFLHFICSDDEIITWKDSWFDVLEIHNERGMCMHGMLTNKKKIFSHHLRESEH